VNLDLVRSAYAEWGRGEFSRTDWADPEIEFALVGVPDPGRWHGLSGMAEAWRGWLAAWDDYRAELDEYRELDDGRVLALGGAGGRGKTSGVDVRTEFAGLWEFREGIVVALTLYSNRRRALADLGPGTEGDASS
jgi:ketosteroid isomerase-like protein